MSNYTATLSAFQIERLEGVIKDGDDNNQPQDKASKKARTALWSMGYLKRRYEDLAWIPTAKALSECK
jgi:hypothetical protein